MYLFQDNQGPKENVQDPTLTEAWWKGCKSKQTEEKHNFDFQAKQPPGLDGRRWLVGALWFQTL